MNIGLMALEDSGLAGKPLRTQLLRKSMFVTDEKMGGRLSTGRDHQFRLLMIGMKSCYTQPYYPPSLH